MNINGIGIDIINLKRIKDNTVIINKILSKKEKTILDKIKDKKRRIEYIGGRWALKEAIIKTGTQIIMSDTTIEFKENKLNYKKFFLSLSHEKKYCIALAIKVG